MAILDSSAFEAALRVEPNALAYHLGRIVSEAARGRFVAEVTDHELDLWHLSDDGFCETIPAKEVHAEMGVTWEGRGKLHRDLGICCSRIKWSGHSFECLRVEWRNFYDEKLRHFILGEDQATVERFLVAALDATHLPSNSILVYGRSCFSRSKKLYAAVQQSSWSDLVLGGDLAERLRGDVRAFLDTRELYRRYSVPYKRGMLLIGPPGNGKTHCMRMLVKEAALPCVYVKSFAARYGEEEANIAQVFERARKIAPCTLVLEDVDSLVREACLSAFLNEMDGLSGDTGILTLATTNHPERLDPALLERPSRFDRKYHFGLPELPERKRYLDHWNTKLETDMQLGDGVEPLAAQTEGMSFAFLKELVISSMAKWMTERKPGSMASLMTTELEALRATWRPFDEGDVPPKKSDKDDD